MECWSFRCRLLRGGREHKMLKLSQFTIHSEESGEFVVYKENGSKNRSGTYKEKADSNKIVKHYADSTLGDKCYVYILKLYFSKLSPTLFEDSSAVFYITGLMKYLNMSRVECGFLSNLLVETHLPPCFRVCSTR